jgi:asparagine synthase (glutamine-hydrolysing)
MCGITGLITRDGSPPSEEMLRRMTDAIRHRGPDADGVWVAPGVGLGHRRLAILDLSPTGAQPMHTEDGTLAIVYNGEIYNYQELRVELEKQGSVFRSTSDTEVILEAYRQWGGDCVKRFRGMFAFALWDAPRARLFFARDRIGKKPFFYRTLPDGTFACASEMKSLIPLAPVSVDRGALRTFIGLQYVPAPRTGFTEIHSLPQGYAGTLSQGRVSLVSYHDWKDIPVSVSSSPAKDVLALLEECVRIRLRADVPVGAFLSGGIDSAAVVALASRYVDRPLRTFTMGFSTIGMDEREEARGIARAFHTDHVEFEARPEHLTDMAERVIHQYDAPYADSSALPLMMLARETGKEIKVVLTGDGGDELFGGYKRYLAFLRALQLAAIPGVASVAPSILQTVSTLMHDPRFARMAETIQGLRMSASRGYGEAFCGAYFSTSLAQEVFQASFLQETQSSDPMRIFTGRMEDHGTPMEQALWFDLHSYLPDDLNVKMDRATMASGLEARAPFLDQQLVAFVQALPLKEKLQYGKTKIVLKEALRDVLPRSVIERKKRGFQVPLASWFRGPLEGYWKERCLDPKGPLADYVRLDAAERLFAENRRGADHGNRLWMLLALSTWLQCH